MSGQESPPPPPADKREQSVAGKPPANPELSADGDAPSAAGSYRTPDAPSAADQYRTPDASSAADPYRAPAASAPSPADAIHEGSLGLGIVLGIALLLLGEPIIAVAVVIPANSLLGSIGVISSSLLALPLLLGPPILVAVTAMAFRGKGQRRTAKGVWLGFAIAVGLVLLLVAACFGIVSGIGIRF